MKADVMELPLFPLNAVLFPGQTLPLHIFEPRYRIMIQRCIEQGQPFGIVLAQDDDDSTPHLIGTAARITQVERLPDGRMNILTVGVERFVLQNIHEGEDEYLIGDAIFYPFKDDELIPNPLVSLVIARLRRYLALLADMSGSRFRFEQFPEDATAVAVFAAIALQLPLIQKQEMLAMEGITDLLQHEAELLKSELLSLTIMASSVRPSEDEDSLIFSKN
jgi:Lon protease-like protein